MVRRYTTYAEMYRMIADPMRSRTRLDLPKYGCIRHVEKRSSCCP